MAIYVPPHRRHLPSSPVSGSPDPAEIDRTALTPLMEHFARASPAYEAWLHAKQQYGADPAVERKFARQRAENRARLAAQGSAESARFRDQFCAALDDVAAQAAGALAAPAAAFLDLGCAPGGFSAWLLARHPAARGLGVSLPRGASGLPMVMEDWDAGARGRYDFVEADLTALPPGFYARAAAVARGGRFDVVVCGARYRDADTFGDARAPGVGSACRDRLVLAQLLAAFRVLGAGGTLVAVASLKLSFATIDTLVFLRAHFRRLVAAKGRHLHSTRSSYYLVCAGFECDEAERRRAVLRIEAALAGLTEDGGREEALSAFAEDQMDFVRSQAEFVVQHLTPLWEDQRTALSNDLVHLRKKPWGDSKSAR